jgi:hypothetical protein
MIRRDFGQLETEATTGAVVASSGATGLLPFYLIAVAAGVTVFLITKALASGRRR